MFPQRRRADLYLDGQLAQLRYVVQVAQHGSMGKWSPNISGLLNYSALWSRRDVLVQNVCWGEDDHRWQVW